MGGGGGGLLQLLKVVETCRWTGYDFPVINGTGYLNRPNWLLTGYSVFHMFMTATVRAERNIFFISSFSFLFTVKQKDRVYPGCAILQQGMHMKNH